MWVVWLMTAFCYVALYYDLLKRAMDFFPEVTNNLTKKVTSLLENLKKSKDNKKGKKE